MMTQYEYQILLADFRSALKRQEDARQSKTWSDLVKTDDPKYIKFHEANTAKWKELLDPKRGIVWKGEL